MVDKNISLQEFAKRIQGNLKGPAGRLATPASSIFPADQANIVQLVSLLIMTIKEKASDIHIEPDDTVLPDPLPDRQDAAGSRGVAENLEAATIPAARSWPNWTSPKNAFPRMAASAQNHEGKEIDLRVSTYPTLRGKSGHANSG